MLRNELEYRNAKKRLDTLQNEVEKRSLAEERETSQTTHAVVEALRMKIEDIKRELVDYENLKNSGVSEFKAGSLDEFGEVVTKARIAKGWSQADLAKAMGTHHQQIQRYERNDWQKINLWRLQEVVDALGLRLNIHARTSEEPARWPGVSHYPLGTVAEDVDLADVWTAVGKGTAGTALTATQEGESGSVDQSKQIAPMQKSEVPALAS
jgi:ribosome-binding protein aMBF1 (putative translation factor)